MRGILINAYKKTVTEVELPDATGQWLDKVYELLSQDMPTGKCDMIEVGWRIPRQDSKSKEDTIYVDEEGLLKPSDHFFYFEGAHQPFAGSGLICGSDNRTGKACGAEMDILSVLSKVRFLTRSEAACRAAVGG